MSLVKTGIESSVRRKEKQMPTKTKKKSTVNKAGNYTKPTMRKRLFEKKNTKPKAEVINNMLYGINKWFDMVGKAYAKLWNKCLVEKKKNVKSKSKSKKS
jgi:hypothetical protein